MDRVQDNQNRDTESFWIHCPVYYMSYLCVTVSIASVEGRVSLSRIYRGVERGVDSNHQCH